ncbi:hypothetical protein [Secundilactobacillus silagei]|uniref:Uncharacterized protein n=1 Tax=Secundilactobacillus silagei JCM 19001 TaxID=1302250 RepID=A0A1Z5IJH5_9LACO|nr:hypothetical protein [Secundilactobacillus silagei]TDG68641.1 hypothetical protein C5L25_001717 [Secundilactobacillus silagei JCM 19001]GAX01910.1 hypothetical protein IWT126_01973 [Secundilactobacillus silagei JCM 19001]
MRLGELITLVHLLDPSLKLGLDTSPIKPISGMSAADQQLLLHTVTQTPLTVAGLRQHAAHFDQDLTVFRSNDERLYGFRQSGHWLLFK